jgi:hypothetical protein
VVLFAGDCCSISERHDFHYYIRVILWYLKKLKFVAEYLKSKEKRENSGKV